MNHWALFGLSIFLVDNHVKDTKTCSLILKSLQTTHSVYCIRDFDVSASVRLKEQVKQLLKERLVVKNTLILSFDLSVCVFSLQGGGTG